MIINNNGILLNGIQDVQASTIFMGSVAIFDIDGACIHIPQSELEKLLNKYIQLKNNSVNQTPPIQKPTDIEIDTEKLFVDDIK